MNSLADINIQHWYEILNALPNPVTLNKKIVTSDGSFYDEILFLNNAFIDTIGYTPEDIPTDKDWFEKAYPDKEYQEFVIQEWTKLVNQAKLNNKNQLAFPAKVLCKDNIERWFQITTNIDYPIVNEYHIIVFIEIQTPNDTILELQNVTKSLQQRNQKLIESENNLAKQYSLLYTIINTVPVGIFWKDLDGIYLGANQAFVEDAELENVSQLIGKTDFDMTWRRDAERFRSDDAEVTNSGIPRLQYEEEQPKEDGSCIYLVTSKVPLEDAAGNTIGILGVYNDVTELKVLQKQAKEKDAQLLAQSRLAQMGEMISMIAHQWRQPLSSLSANAISLKLKLDMNAFDLNTQKGQEEQYKHFTNVLKKMEDHVINLTKTIDDFRDFYKPDKRSIKISFKDVLEKAMSIIGASLKNSNISIIYNYHSHEKIKMFDREMMQVLLNILVNAQDNFKERNIIDGQITIRTYANSLSICDNGKGINNEIIEQIFDPYFSTKDKKNGTGLGLYMSKMIVEEHHGGKLLAENTNDGTCFTITLP